jgi:nucleoside phosphorylase
VTAIVAVTALRVETRAVLNALTRVRRVRPTRLPTWEAEAGAHPVTIVQGGVGPAAARRVTEELPRCDVLLSLGFAGALTRGLVAGDVVLPEEIVWEQGREIRRYRVPAHVLDRAARALRSEPRLRTVAGALLSSPVVIASPSAKRAEAERLGATAVEMEAAPLATFAEARAVPFVALRVILDSAELSLEPLPPGVSTSWAARARLVARPAAWSLVGQLRRHLGVAAPVLTLAARAAMAALPER